MSAINTADSRVAAQAVHDLGAALWFGGSVMGVAGVNKSGRICATGSTRSGSPSRPGAVSRRRSGSGSAPCWSPARG